MLRNGHSIERYYICLSLFPFLSLPVSLCVFQFILLAVCNCFAPIFSLPFFPLLFHYPLCISRFTRSYTRHKNHFATFCIGIYMAFMLWRTEKLHADTQKRRRRRRSNPHTPANKWIECYLIVCETEANGNNTIT